MTASALWTIGISVLAALGTTALTVVALVRLPPDALKESLPDRARTLPRKLARIGRNLIGWVLIASGIVLAVPGIPGQGLLTILVGLLLVDVPGRRRLLLRLLRRPGLRRGIDRLRERFGKPPMEWDDLSEEGRSNP